MAFVVTLLGGESTGKSRLSQALLERLEASRLTTVLVREHLRDWCTEQGRAPFSHEQLALAREQARQIDTAATLSGVDVVIADTTGLMIAAYSELYFTNVLWPDFDETEFALALADYSRRERRFGLREPPADEPLGAVDA